MIRIVIDNTVLLDTIELAKYVKNCMYIIATWHNTCYNKNESLLLLFRVNPGQNLRVPCPTSSLSYLSFQLLKEELPQ